MAVSEKLQFLITADAQGAIRAFQQVGKAADKELGKAENKLDKLGANMTKFGVGALATAGVVGAGLWKLGEGASDLNETISKSNVIFGKAAKTIEDFGTDAAKSIGQSKQAAIDAAATFGTFGKSAGKTGEDLARFSIDMTKLASDMASFSNTSPEEAVLAIGAALRGESEPIRKYGVLLSDAALKNRALEMGIYDGVGALTAQQKVLAAQAEILAQTGDAQGDFARTSDGLANQQRILAAELQNTKDAIGSAVLPAMQAVVGVAGDVFGAFNALPPTVQTTIGKFAGFGTAALAVAGVTSVAVGQLIKMRDTFSTLDAAGNRSMTRLGKATVATTAVIGVAAIVYQGYTSKKEAATRRTEEFTDALLAEEKGQEGATSALVASNIVETKAFGIRNKLGISTQDLAAAIDGKTVPAITKLRESYDKARAGGASLDQQNRALEEQYGLGSMAIQAFLQRLDEQSDSMAQAKNNADELTDAERALAGATKYGTDITDRQANVSKNLATVLDGDTTPAVRTLTDSTELARKAAEKLDRQWDELKGEIDDERAFLDMEQTFIDLRTAAEEAYIATASGADDAAEKQRTFRNAVLDAREQVIELGSDVLNLPKSHVTALQILADQGQFDELERRLAILTRNRTMNLDIIARGGAGYGSLTPTPRAMGGPVSAGQPYLVGERGPELVVPSGSGNVIPAGKTASMLGGTTVINITTGADPNAVVAAIKKYEKSNGAAWRS